MSERFLSPRHDERLPQGCPPFMELPLIVPTLPGPDAPPIPNKKGPSKGSGGRGGAEPRKRRRFPPFTIFGLLSLALGAQGPAMSQEPLLDIDEVDESVAFGGVLGGGRVHTPQGLASAGSIAQGDWVLAGDPSQGGIGYAQVMDVRRRLSQGVYRLFLGDERGLQDVLVLGAAQRLWVFGQGWAEVEALQAGMRIRSADGTWICLLGTEPVKESRELVHLSLEPDLALVLGLDGIFSRDPL